MTNHYSTIKAVAVLATALLIAGASWAQEGESEPNGSDSRMPGGMMQQDRMQSMRDNMPEQDRMAMDDMMDQMQSMMGRMDTMMGRMHEGGRMPRHEMDRENFSDEMQSLMQQMQSMIDDMEQQLSSPESQTEENNGS